MGKWRVTWDPQILLANRRAECSVCIIKANTGRNRDVFFIDDSWRL